MIGIVLLKISDLKKLFIVKNVLVLNGCEMLVNIIVLEW